MIARLVIARFLPALVLTGSLLLTGCGRSDIGLVKGTVTMDGQPLPNALVTFQPDGGRPSFGRTDDTGNYELVYSGDTKGAAIGKHRVSISTLGSGDEDSGEEATEETVPAKYNTETELTAEVKGGRNQLDFALASGGEIRVNAENQE